MNIPGDVLNGETLIRLSGNREVIIENYIGIHLYTSEEVVISCKKLTLRIYGEKLHIQYFSKGDMKVTGSIHTITYMSNGELSC